MSRKILAISLISWAIFITSCTVEYNKSTKIEPPSIRTDNLLLPQIGGIPKIVPFREVELHEDWGLGDSFDYSVYKGIFRDEKELKDVWVHMVNAWKESGYSGDRAKNLPVMPIIDFNEYSVIWYANYGSGTSLVIMNEILEFKDIVQINITLV